MTIPLMNATKPWELIVYVNEVTNYWFGTFMLVIIFVVSYLSTTHLPSNRSLAISSFLTCVMSVLFWFIGVIELKIVYISLGFLALSIIFLGGEAKQ